MSILSWNSSVLPVLRPDIEFHDGPDDPDGSPTCIVHDPLQSTFDRATWVQAVILKLLRTPHTIGELLRQLSTHTTIRVREDDIRKLCADASNKGLTIDSCVADLTNTQAQRVQPKHAPFEVLFRKLLYMRIPLLKPDAFLTRTIGWARHIASPAAMAIYAIISAVGIAILMQRFDAYLSTFPYFFNAYGVTLFALAIIIVKIVHELSHAYVAKAMGNRVPTMGVALILLFPLAYSDVTDSWKMHSRRKRSLIGLAGVIAELVIAGLALFVWAISPPGLCKSICFVVSSATLISTLLVNLNPAMRFDGYYVLSDLLGIDNLQSRSFTTARWTLRRHLLGMRIEAPEPELPPRRIVFMVAYSVFAWCYRLFLFSGIALMLYHRVTKVVGAALFAATIYTFLVRPVVAEVLSLMKMRRDFGWNRRMVAVAIGLGLAFLWIAVPLPRWHATPATTTPRDSQVIYTPRSGVIRELDIALAGRVSRGKKLFVIESEELNGGAKLAELNTQRISIELAIVKNDQTKRALLPEKTEELARAIAKQESIRAAIDSNRIVADIDGTVVEWDESVREGTPIAANQVLGKMVDSRSPGIACYVRHDLVSDVSPDDRVYFISNTRPGRLWGTVTNVNPVPTAFLEHSALSSISGGDIAVAPDSRGRLEVVDSYYEVEVELDLSAQSLRLGQTGCLWMRTAPRSRLVDLVRHLHRVLVRESSF